MIELAAFKEHRVILALSDYLKSIGISNNIEVEPDRFALILHKQEDVERAEKELAAFLQNPQAARYWQASWQTGQVIKQKIDTDSVGLFVGAFGRVYLIYCVYLYRCLWLAGFFRQACF